MNSEQLLEHIQEVIANEDRRSLEFALQDLHPADAAEVLAELSPQEVAKFVELVGPQEGLETFEFVPLGLQKEALSHMERATLTKLMSLMSPDDRADLVEELDDESQERLLSLLSKNMRQNVLRLMDYPEDSAGAFMTTNYALLHPESNVQGALNELRLQAADAETVYYIYVVDRGRRLQGLVSLRDLIVAPRNSRVGDIMSTPVISVKSDEDIEEVAKLSSRYDFLAVPVVDDQERMLGIITFDDLYDVLTMEATEDMYHLANLDTDEKINSTVFRSVKLRVPWLLVNLGTGLIAAYVVSCFAHTIHQVVALASLMTIVALLGGNAGNQSLTVVVRALALGEITLTDNWKVLGKEVLVGMCNGVIIGLVIGVISYLWYGNGWLGIIMWLALVCNLIIAALAGASVPIVLRKLKLDPALGSSIFVTTATDVGGFFIFLGLASLVLHHLMGT